MKIDQNTWNELLSKSQDARLNKKELTIDEIGSTFNVTKWTASCWKFALDNKDTIHNDVTVPLSSKREKQKVKSLTNINNTLLEELEQANERLDFALSISPNKKYEIPSYKRDNNKKTSEKRNAAAFGILSDVHIEENVTLEQTDGVNEYTPEIAKIRIENFFKNLLKLVNKERAECNIDILVLGLLGDFITGYIHEELVESNNMSPTEATSYVRNLLMQGIKYLVDEGNFKKIIIPCTPGNHGRTTRIKRFSTGYKNSYEWMMYQDMKKIIDDYLPEKYKNTIDLITSKNELIYIQVFDYTIRFGHGDHFKFAGGIGGLTVPLKKWLMRMNEQRKADMTFIGHWHTLLLGATEDCMVNASVMGLNSYGKQFGGIPKPPQQIFALLDEIDGFTLRTPIRLYR